MSQGAAGPPPTGSPLRFVLLEHRWDGVHWDLMLEAEGRLRTWSLASIPTAGAEVEATSLPDHRLVYLDYEGPISGDRGVVRRVDRGTYEPILWQPDHVRVRLAGDHVIGDAELVRLSERCWRLGFGKFI